MIGTASDPPLLARVADELAARRRIAISSHVRPDGDSIGSQLALALALAARGAEVRVVNRDPAPAHLAGFPGVDRIEIAERVEGDFDAAVVLECGDLSRTGVTGFERFFVINIDHHPGNTMYGAINWFDESAAACGEMIFQLVGLLGVPLSAEMATHLYVAILTDTGSFHYSGVTPRTFDICRRLLEAGVDPVAVARRVYDSRSIGRLRLWAAVLSSMEIQGSGRLALIYLDDALLERAGATYDDTEGLINEPLTVREIEAVVFFKRADGDRWRVSFRSKGSIDVGAVAAGFGGGGHKNAAGCTIPGHLDEIRPAVVERVLRAIDAGIGHAPPPIPEP